MNREILIVYAVLVSAAILFLTNRVRSDLVAILVMLALMISGVLSVGDCLAGFADPVVMIIIAMFIVSEALVNTGIAQRIGEMVMAAGQGSETRLIVMLMLAAGGVGAFMNSTAAVAIFLPVTLTVARKTGFNRKRLLMPLAIGSLISGMMTLVATAPNLVVAQVLASADLEPLGFFSFTPFGVVILGIAIVFMLLGGRGWLSREKRREVHRRRRSMSDIAAAYGVDRQLVGLRVPPTSALVDRAVARIQVGETFNIHLVAFQKPDRGGVRFVQAAPEVVFEANDGIVAVGLAEHVTRFAEAYGLLPVTSQGQRYRREFMKAVGVAEIMLSPESKLIGKTVVESRFRSRYKVHVLGIRRRGAPVSEPIADIPLEFGDTLLVNAAWPDIFRLRSEQEQFVLLGLPEESADVIPAAAMAPRALLILAAMVVAMASGLVPTVMAALVAALLLVLSRCVDVEAVYRVINWQAVVLIAGILPLAAALNQSGAAHLLSLKLVEALGGLGPYGMLSLIFMVTAVTGLFISNTATAVLIAPVAIDAAITVNAPPHAFAMTVAIACSAAYVTPVSSPVNMMVLEPGGYVFMDFVKIGIPLLLLSMLATVVLVGAIYMP
jgi:di/tricarboxylate transporter